MSELGAQGEWVVQAAVRDGAGGWSAPLNLSEADKAAAAKSVAPHLTRFWDPRMRREIIAHYREGGAGLDPVVRSAIGLLSTPD